MKNTLLFSGFLSILFLLSACTKTESDFTMPAPETIKIEASSLSVITGTAVDFTIISSINNANVTSLSKIFINGTEISGKTYTFSAVGNYAVYSIKGSLTSNIVTIAVTAVPPAETIRIETSSLSVTAGTPVNFTIFSSINNTDVTSASKIFVNGTEINGKSYIFSAVGNFTVYATKGMLASNNIIIAVTAATTTPNSYVHNVLVEEYSGTWCGNCPRLLYGVDLLHQQTQKAFVVGIHLLGSDPFISADGNNLAAMRGVSGVPTGHINRTVNWTGPQYENVSQVINYIKPSATLGLAISSTLNASNLNVVVKFTYKEAAVGSTRLTVYLVEDNLNYTQRNYSSNLYGGQANIPNFSYSGVLRSVVSALAGDVVPNTGNANEKPYSLTLPSNISNAANAFIIAFITDAAGNVLNVQRARLGTVKDFEKL
jgi:hypothetical protein